jgi:hypothetical protein
MTEPIAGAYDASAAGQEVQLYEGHLEIGDFTGSGRIWLQLACDLGFRWEFTDDEWRFLEVGDAELSFTHPIYGATRLPTVIRSSSGSGDLPGSEIGAADGLDELIVHWLNVPQLGFGTSLEQGGAQWVGRWHAQAAGWDLTCDARFDPSQLFNTAKDGCEHLITHVGRLRRSDGTRFSMAQASELLAAWQTAFSFAAGRWVAPVLAVGFTKGARVAEQWQPWRCFHPASPQGWWDPHRAEDVSELTALLVEAWFDSARHDTIRHFAFHVIEANTVGTLEARIMLLGAGLEYLSWVRHVIDDGRRPKDHKLILAADKLRELLVEAQIPALQPVELDALGELIAEKSGENEPLQDGPGAIAWVRNRLVHPKDAGEPYRIKGLLRDIWSLQLQYADLILLNELGYCGQYRQRFPPWRWAHDRKPVPWVADQVPPAPSEPASNQ